MVFQKYSSFPWLSVIDNVSLGLKYRHVSEDEAHKQAKEMIKIVGLEGQEHKYAQSPMLSGGQLQRVAIARSLLASSSILLMDEPFGALDIKTRLKMQELINSIYHKINMTVIFVTHDVSEALYLADEILIMSANPGRIVEKINVPLPEVRTKDMKRSSEFTKMVYDIEDKIYNLENKI
jgi:NitT/TauT family transport system ATP-binding protein